MSIASNTQPSTIGTVLQRQKDHSRTPIPCPESIILYNKYMGGVDRGDQLRGYIIAAGQKVRIHLSLLVRRGNPQTLTFSKRVSALTSRTSRTTGSSWQCSWLGSTVAVSELAVGQLSFDHYPSTTFQWESPAILRWWNTRGDGVHIVKKQAKLTNGSTESVKCGCVTAATLMTVFYCSTHGG